jgi:hypothetical protein
MSPFPMAGWLVVTLLLPTLWDVNGASAFLLRRLVRRQHGSDMATSSSFLGMATWSDSKAVEEYKNFLDTGLREPLKKQDCPSVIIMEPDTNCELAEALFSMGIGDDLVMAPYDYLPEQIEGNYDYPIYVTLPPWAIADFIANLPQNYLDRAGDFVFFSGGLAYGNIEDVLKSYGYCRDSMTQVLITGMKYTPAKQVQDLSVNLGLAANEEQKVAGQCTACGKWNGAISERMSRNNVSCKTDFYREWRRQMWEQSMADAVFHLLGVVRAEPTSVANVATYYSGEVGDVVWEISAQMRGWKALTLTYGFEERIYGVAEATGGDQQCIVFNEMYPYIWGAAVFLQSKLYLQYLHYAQSEMGFFQGIQLPPIDENKPNIIRSGNLRADGVV